MGITASSLTDILNTAQIASPLTTIDDVVEDILEAMIGPPSNGVQISDVNFFNNSEQAFLVDSLQIGSIIDLSGGLLFTSGGLPDDLNDLTDSTVAFGGPGDPDFDAVAQAAFQSAGVTTDAVGIEFNVTVTDQTINGLSFDIVFGSEEFPEYSDSNFVDVAAIIVNGVNYALFNNDPTQPLSVIGRNLENGNFVDNTLADFNTEYDGFSNILTVRLPLDLGSNSVKIGVADTGDFSLDSGIYITNAELLTDGGTGGGTLQSRPGTPGDDTLVAGQAGEEFDLTAGGQDTICGVLSAFDGDVITGFGLDDTLLIKDSILTAADFTIVAGEGGSLIVSVNGDDDPAPEAVFTLTGAFTSSDFELNIVDGSTFFTLAAPDDGGGDGGTGDGGTGDGGTGGGGVGGTGDGGDGGVGSGDGGAGTTGDHFIGTDGKDKFSGTSLDDIIEGNKANDVLRGKEGNDYIDGGSGNDRIYGEEDDDILDGGNGHDKIDGGSGDDIINGANGRDRLYGDTGADEITGGNGNDVIGLSVHISRVGDNAADTVFFDNDDGSDKVYAFESGLDQVVLTDGGTYTLTQIGGGNSVLEYGDTTVIFYDAHLVNDDIIVA